MQTPLLNWTFAVPSPPEKPEIPRTGQLWWPVLLLAFAGALLIVIGAGRILRAKRED